MILFKMLATKTTLCTHNRYHTMYPLYVPTLCTHYFMYPLCTASGTYFIYPIRYPFYVPIRYLLYVPHQVPTQCTHQILILCIPLNAHLSNISKIDLSIPHPYKHPSVGQLPSTDKKIIHPPLFGLNIKI